MSIIKKLNKIDKYIIPLCNYNNVCSIAFRLVRPCKTLDSGESGGVSESGGASGPDTGYSLFDRSSWSNGQVPLEIAYLLNTAASNWEAQVTFDPMVAAGLAFYDTEWNGIVLNSYEEADYGPGYIASVSVDEAISLGTSINGFARYNALSFNLTINTYYYPQSIPGTSWPSIMTHELGHALGIGTLWGEAVLDSIWLDGTKAVLTQSAYNINRDKIPLEDTGGPGTRGAHWENNSRSEEQTYSGISDVMIAFASTFGITAISKNLLLDLGYVANISALNSFNIDINNELYNNSCSDVKCGCGTNVFTTMNKDAKKPSIAYIYDPTTHIVIKL